MSLKLDLNVAEIVEKYKERFPNDSRPELRRRIRTENLKIFNNPTKLRQLDRLLRKEFKAKAGFGNSTNLKLSDATGVFSSRAEIKPAEPMQLAVAENIKFDCLRCNKKVMIQRIHTGGPPSLKKIKCPFCGFENNIPPVNPSKETSPCTVNNEKMSSATREEKIERPRFNRFDRFVESIGIREDPLEDLQKAEAEQKDVMDAMEELRRELRFFREPTVDEVALKTGRKLETVKPLLYSLAPKTGWKPQSQERAEKEAKDTINLAGWLCWKEKSGYLNPKLEDQSRLEDQSKEAVNNASADMHRRAQNILTNYPDLVPKVYRRKTTAIGDRDLAGLVWSETRFYWP